MSNGFTGIPEHGGVSDYGKKCVMVDLCFFVSLADVHWHVMRCVAVVGVWDSRSV